MEYSKFLFAIIFFTSTVRSYAQYISKEFIPDWNQKYYPENKFIKDQKIKFITDSSQFQIPTSAFTQGYDTLGRLIGEFNNESKSFDKPYIYRQNKDTVYRIKYANNSTELYSLEKFVYNRQGQISKYTLCYNNDNEKFHFTIEQENFFYGNKVLKSKLRYFNELYKGVITENLIFSVKDLELTEAINYEIQNLENGNKIIISKHNFEKKKWQVTDTTLVDKKDRIVKFNSFTKIAPTGYTLDNKVTEYYYKDSAVIISNYTIHCSETLLNLRCKKYERIDEDKRTLIFDKSDKKVKEYIYYGNNEEQLLHKFYYEYFK